MSLTIETQALPDPPAFAEFLAPANLLGGYFQVTSNPARVELVYGRYGAAERLPQVDLPPGSYSVGRSPSGDPLVGIRAQNASPGVGATFGGYFWTESDPTLSFIGVASSQIAGTVVIPVIELVDWPPASPADGQTAWLELPASPYNPIGGEPIRWLTTWNNAAGIWNVTGAPLYARVETQQGRNAVAYGDLATLGPDMTIPLGGDYILSCGAKFTSPAGVNGSAYMSYDVGATAALDDDAASFSQTFTDGGQPGMSPSLERYKAGLLALDLVRAKYRTGAVAGANRDWENRWLKIEPVLFD